jgi:hypothetical protein
MYASRFVGPFRVEPHFGLWMAVAQAHLKKTMNKKNPKFVEIYKE